MSFIRTYLLVAGRRKNGPTKMISVPNAHFYFIMKSMSLLHLIRMSRHRQIPYIFTNVFVQIFENNWALFWSSARQKHSVELRAFSSIRFDIKHISKQYLIHKSLLDKILHHNLPQKLKYGQKILCIMKA